MVPSSDLDLDFLVDVVPLSDVTDFDALVDLLGPPSDLVDFVQLNSSCWFSWDLDLDFEALVPLSDLDLDFLVDALMSNASKKSTTFKLIQR